tara:strand:+ start:48 stop:242 length:195 start_codon:yes stop_codon:yes gene_type:complete
LNNDENVAFSAALKLMNGDQAAAENWLNESREIFGNISAIEMVRSGQVEKVLALVGRIQHGVFS